MNTRCAVEVGLDDIAEQLAVDPISLRMANLSRPTAGRSRVFASRATACAKPPSREGGERLGPKFRQMPLGKGIGIGCGFFISGLASPFTGTRKFSHATVHLQIDMDGGVTVHTGAADIG